MSMGQIQHDKLHSLIQESSVVPSPWDVIMAGRRFQKNEPEVQKLSLKLCAETSGKHSLKFSLGIYDLREQ